MNTVLETMNSDCFHFIFPRPKYSIVRGPFDYGDRIIEMCKYHKKGFSKLNVISIELYLPPPSHCLPYESCNCRRTQS